MGGAVLGRVLELDQAAAKPARPEFRGPDLEVEVGLAAGLRDLAPAGADLVALSGVDPMVGSVVGDLVDRDDGQSVEGLVRVDGLSQKRRAVRERRGGAWLDV